MKIGILTHHYVKNFGATLQATALSETVKSLCPNAKVEFINYSIKEHKWKNIIRFFRYRLNRDTIPSFLEKLLLLRTHTKEEQKLPLSSKMKSIKDINNNNYDMIIIGSDEVWNFTDIAYSPIKFGYDLACTNVITYAASVGNSSVNDIVPFEIDEGLKSLRKIAVRDDRSLELCNSRGVRAIKVLDPVFIYEFPDLTDSSFIKKLPKKYILIYDCRLTDSQIKLIQKLSKEKNMEIIGAGEFLKWYSRKTINLTIIQWTYLFKHASLIITGTFHGASFSIKYRKNFVVYATEENRIRKVNSLLNDLQLSDRIVTPYSRKENFVSLLEAPIDYNKINKNIENKIELSLDYLKQSLQDLRC